MSKGNKNGTKLAAELISKGATMLSEPCPQCGGIQLRYHGKVFCTNHDDLSTIARLGAASVETVTAAMREVILSKLGEIVTALEGERDWEKQEQLVSLMTKYFDLLQKFPK